MLDNTSNVADADVTTGFFPSFDTLSDDMRTGINVGIRAGVMLGVAYGTIIVAGISLYGAAKGGKFLYTKSRNLARNVHYRTLSTADLWRTAQADATVAAPAPQPVAEPAVA